jgi:hypothetical protein
MNETRSRGDPEKPGVGSMMVSLLSKMTGPLMVAFPF